MYGGFQIKVAFGSRSFLCIHVCLGALSARSCEGWTTGSPHHG